MKVTRIVAILLLGILLVSASACCPEGAGPEATPTPTPVSQITDEWEAESCVVEHLYDTATTYHGQLVLAEIVDFWGGGRRWQDIDGSWMVTIWLDDFQVEGNPLLEPIFKDPRRYCGHNGGYYSLLPHNPCFPGDPDYGVQYEAMWWISPDGTQILPADGNAIRLEAELSME